MFYISLGAPPDGAQVRPARPLRHKLHVRGRGDQGAAPHPVPDLRSGRLFYFIIGLKREGLGRET